MTGTAVVPGSNLWKYFSFCILGGRNFLSSERYLCANTSKTVEFETGYRRFFCNVRGLHAHAPVPGLYCHPPMLMSRRYRSDFWTGCSQIWNQKYNEIRWPSSDENPLKIDRIASRSDGNFVPSSDENAIRAWSKISRDGSSAILDRARMEMYQYCTDLGWKPRIYKIPELPLSSDVHGKPQFLSSARMDFQQ